MSTDYGNRGGSGERNNFGIVVSQNGLNYGGVLTTLINGNLGTADGISLDYPQSFSSGDYLEFDFDTAVVIDEVRWYQDAAANTLGSWKWQGYNPAIDTNWHDIGASPDFTLGGSSPQLHTTLNGNTTAYTKYRLYCNSGSTPAATYINEVEFQIDVVTTVSYLNTLGCGNRTATITVTGGTGLWNGTPSILVDGATATGLYFNVVTVDSSQFVAFDFGASYVMTEAKWEQSDATTHGVWQWQGSDDAGFSPNTPIGGNFTLGGGTTAPDGGKVAVLTELNGNTNAYRYYRMLGVSGSTSNTPWILEALFQIGTPAAPGANVLLTTFAKNKILNQVFGTSSYSPPATVYALLLTADPTATGDTASEAAYGGYNRTAITFGAASARTVTQSGVATFPACTSGSSAVTYWAVADGGTPGAGNILAYGPLASPVTVATGAQPSLTNADVSIQFSTGGVSTAYANTILNWLFRNQTLSSVTGYIALLSSPSSDTAIGTELSGNNYGRASESVWSNASGGSTSNTESVAFPAATGTWTAATDIAILDNSSGGTFMFYATLTKAVTAKISDRVRFEANTVTITI